MSTGWFPVIDQKKCGRCGVCHGFCPNGVYIEDDGLPVVVKPDNCVHGCRGCQSRCSFEAIRYEGDNGIITGGMTEITDL